MSHRQQVLKSIKPAEGGVFRLTVGCHSFFNIMPLTIQQKKDIVSDLREKLRKQQGIMLVDFSAVPADIATDFRGQLRQENCLLQSVKKSLLRRAIAEEKIPINIDLMGSVSLVLGFDDLVTPAKLIYKFGQKNEQLKIVGGIWDNELKDQEAVISLAQLPSYPEAMARFVWLLKSPISGLVNTMHGVTRSFVIALSEVQKVKNN